MYNITHRFHSVRRGRGLHSPLKRARALKKCWGRGGVDAMVAGIAMAAARGEEGSGRRTPTPDSDEHLEQSKATGVAPSPGGPLPGFPWLSGDPNQPSPCLLFTYPHSYLSPFQSKVYILPHSPFYFITPNNNLLPISECTFSGDTNLREKL